MSVEKMNLLDYVRDYNLELKSQNTHAILLYYVGTSFASLAWNHMNHSDLSVLRSFVESENLNCFQVQENLHETQVEARKEADFMMVIQILFLLNFINNFVISNGAIKYMFILYVY